MELIAALTLLAGSCNTTTKEPSFEIRNFALKTEEATYGTTFSYTGTVLARGDDDVAKQPYIVAVEYHYLGGGDPEKQHDSTNVGFVTVMNGAGDLEVGGGYRSKKSSISEGDTWPPPRLTARVLGYVPINLVHTAK